MAAGEYELAEAGETMGDGSLGLFLRGCFAATDEDRPTGRMLVLFGLVGSIAACVWYPCGYELVSWYGRLHTRLVLRRSLTSLRPSVRREAHENGRRNEVLLNRWAFEVQKTNSI